jgi:Protein of unknown function (DUF3072)
MKDTRASGVNRIDVALIGEAEGRSDTGNRGFSRCVGQRRAKRNGADLRGYAALVFDRERRPIAKHELERIDMPLEEPPQWQAADRGVPSAAGTLDLEERLSIRTIHERCGREQSDDKQKRGAATERRRNQSQDPSRAEFQCGERSGLLGLPGRSDDGAQASYLKTLSEEVGEPDNFKPELTKAEASKRIDALKSKRSSAQQR